MDAATLALIAWLTPAAVFLGYMGVAWVRAWWRGRA
jgi:hypothetical protein